MKKKRRVDLKKMEMSSTWTIATTWVRKEEDLRLKGAKLAGKRMENYSQAGAIQEILKELMLPERQVR